MSSEQARELRAQGIAAAKAGQKDQARTLLQQSLRLDPANEAGWVWLMSVARDRRERLICLHKLLEINPQNQVGLQSLNSLGLTRDDLATQIRAAGSGAAPAPAAPQPAAPARQATPPAPQAPPQVQTPGVPIPEAEAVSRAQAEVDSIVRAYLSQTDYRGVVWTEKTRGRAGERDALRLRLYIAGGVAGMLIVLFAVGSVIVLTNPELRGIVFAPTHTPTFTPTLTPTNTPGVTPTPSPTPELTATPIPTVPSGFPNGTLTPLPQPTDFYPPVDRSVRDAVAVLNTGNLATALPLLELEVTKVSGGFDPNPYYFRAVALAESGEGLAALDLLVEAEGRLGDAPNRTQAAIIDTGFAYVNMQLAKESLADGSASQANAFFSNVEDRAEAAIEKDPRIAQPYLLLAERFALDGEISQAIGQIDDGLAVPGLNADLNLILRKGELYFERGDYDLAAYQAFLALYVNPTNEEALVLQIQSALAQGDPGLGVIRAEQYLFYYPGSVLGYKLLGDARRLEDKNDLALVAYDQALAGDEDDPAYLEALLTRAELLSGQRRYAAAFDDLSRALDLSDTPEVRARRMLAAYAAGSLSEAEDDAEELLGTGVLPDAEIELMQARILIDRARAGDDDTYTDALVLLVNLSNLPGNLQPVANEYLARAQYNLEDYDAALNAVERALAVAETGSRRFLRGQILEARAEEGDIEAAIRDYDWVLTWSTVYPYPFLPDARSRLSDLLEAAGDS